MSKNEKNCKKYAVIYNFPLMVWQEKHNQSHLQSWKNKRREMTYTLVKATLDVTLNNLEKCTDLQKSFKSFDHLPSSLMILFLTDGNTSTFLD